MERSERRGLRIAGEPLADLDFTAMFVQLAYLRAGLPLPNRDPYDGIVDGHAGHGADVDTARKAAKVGMSALFFRTGQMERLPAAMKRLLGKDWNARKFQEAVQDRHPGIAHLFGTDVGLAFMFTESTILVRTLLDLIDQGVAALPVHDGLMVPASHQATAEKAMARVSRAVVGVSLPVKSVTMQ